MEGHRTEDDLRQIAVFKRLIWLAVLGAVVALGAGLLLLILDPDAGSSTESTLGATAAISGLATGALAGAAAIYAQVKNLWRFVPTWGRVVAWIVIVGFVIYGWIQV